MITMRMTADVPADRQLTFTLPNEVPLGPVEVVVTVETPARQKKPRTSLSQWADENAEHWGDEMNSEDVEGFTGRSY